MPSSLSNVSVSLSQLQQQKTAIGTLENTSSGSAYELLLKKGEGAFSTVYAARCVKAPDRALHERKLHAMSPPVLRVGSLVAVKRIRKDRDRDRDRQGSDPADPATSHLNFSQDNVSVFSGSNLVFGGRNVVLDSINNLGDAENTDKIKGLSECDFLRRLTWTTNVFVTGVRPPGETDSEDEDALDGSTSRHIIDSGQGLVLEREIGSGGGVVKLFEVIETDDSLFFVMEFCHMDLYHLITTRNGLPVQIVKDLFTQIANSVHFCHENSVYHRDLKPENILIDTTDFSIRLADFGLATESEWSENYGCGSVRYMSPECLGLHIPVPGHHKDHERHGYSSIKNDVWSLGVILINLVFARNPWHSPKDKFCRTDYLFLKRPVLIEEFGLSTEFDNVLRCCFDPNPETRCGVLELRDMVWRLASFTWDGVPNGNDALEPLPPPPPSEWGAIRKVYIGIDALSDASSTTSEFSRRQLDTLQRLERSTLSSESVRRQTRKNLTLSMSALQKFLVSDPGEDQSLVMNKGIEMKLDDSQLSSLSASSGPDEEEAKQSTNAPKQEFLPNILLVPRERSSSLTNAQRPGQDQMVGVANRVPRPHTQKSSGLSISSRTGSSVGQYPSSTYSSSPQKQHLFSPRVGHPPFAPALDGAYATSAMAGGPPIPVAGPFSGLYHRQLSQSQGVGGGSESGSAMTVTASAGSIAARIPHPAVTPNRTRMMSNDVYVASAAPPVVLPEEALLDDFNAVQKGRIRRASAMPQMRHVSLNNSGDVPATVGGLVTSRPRTGTDISNAAGVGRKKFNATASAVNSDSDSVNTDDSEYNAIFGVTHDPAFGSSKRSSDEFNAVFRGNH
ncbi:hypothetical protein HDU84_006116 [Entophlyctis sp. JEL0112]|nr:hypothetical protein HDU84_006116 [Entophlyctis sp. JEL0112]